jgi:hypothetical protein
MGKQISNTVLMTGAGYTKNFGGFLAEDMWEKIFNHKDVQDKPALKKLHFDNDSFDYESVYHKVCNGDYSPKEKEAIHIAIREAYEELDVIAQNYIPVRDDSKHNVLIGAEKIIDYLTRDMSQINFFFTLNQDLFVERLISCKCKNITRPAFEGRIFIPKLTGSQRPLDKNKDFVNVPTGDKLDTIKHATDLSHLECHYIKLHGSFDWKSSGPDRPEMMVIGRNKEEQIADELLLTRYLDLFEQVLFQGGIKLLIIGYGFRDNHINEVITKAIGEEYGLKLYIMSTAKPKEFKKELIKADKVYGKQILKGISGYFQSSFGDLFPPDGSETPKWRELKKTFFND